MNISKVSTSEIRECISCRNAIQENDNISEDEMGEFPTYINRDSDAYEDVGKTGWIHFKCLDDERGIDNDYDIHPKTYKEYKRMNDVEEESEQDISEREHLEQLLKNTDKTKEELIDELKKIED
jgi:hypothetical protein